MGTVIFEGSWLNNSKAKEWEMFGERLTILKSKVKSNDDTRL